MSLIFFVDYSFDESLNCSLHDFNLFDISGILNTPDLIHRRGYLILLLGWCLSFRSYYFIQHYIGNFIT